MWLIKTNENGIDQWKKTFDLQDNEVGTSVQQTIDGGYIITGTSSPNLILIKTDVNGNVN